MLPSENLSTGRSVIGSRTILASKFCTLALCENGAGEAPRYHKMVGTGLPVELQVMLIDSPSCIVTMPFRFMVAGTPADIINFYGSLICMFRHKTYCIGQVASYNYKSQKSFLNENKRM